MSIDLPGEESKKKGKRRIRKSKMPVSKAHHGRGRNNSSNTFSFILGQYLFVCGLHVLFFNTFLSSHAKNTTRDWFFKEKKDMKMVRKMTETINTKNCGNISIGEGPSKRRVKIHFTDLKTTVTKEIDNRGEMKGKAKKFIDDFGKYEKIVVGAGCLLDSLGINTNINVNDLRDNDLRDNIEIEDPVLDNCFPTVVISSKDVDIDETNIPNMVENIEKYHKLRDFVRFLNTGFI